LNRKARAAKAAKSAQDARDRAWRRAGAARHEVEPRKPSPPLGKKPPYGGFFIGPEGDLKGGLFLKFWTISCASAGCVRLRTGGNPVDGCREVRMKGCEALISIKVIPPASGIPIPLVRNACCQSGCTVLAHFWCVVSLFVLLMIQWYLSLNHKEPLHEEYRDETVRQHTYHHR
jgi:hypothetical protein